MMKLSAVPPLAAALPVAGELIAGGKYALSRRIGEGGMGVVYEATHVRLRQRVAIKVLRPDVSGTSEVLARFEREAWITAQLCSIHSARIIDVDRLPNGLPYIVLEYLEGRDLEAELCSVGPLPIPEAIDVVMQVAEAMKEAHALGIVHRDLKPANLFVCRAGGRRVMKIVDFGISRLEHGSERITHESSYVGTPLYAAPEQLRDSSGADARSDVWSLGVVLFELLTGRTPFCGSAAEVIARVMVDPVPSPCELRPELPRDLARVVLRALERDPDRRFQSMGELSEALAPFGLTESTDAAIACAHRSRGRLGEILVADGLLSSDDLARALGEQRRTGRLLGRVLVDLGLVAQGDLLAALAKQQGIGVEPGESGGELADAWFDEAVPVEPEYEEPEAPPSHATASSRWLTPARSAGVALAAVWIGSMFLAVAAAR
jgi:serine/threonine-protein kinase